MKLWHSAALLVASAIAATPAFAQSSVPEELTGYNGVLVNFNETAEECNLSDKAMFADHIREKLAEIGLTENPASAVTVALAISAKKFGVSCTAQTTMAFNTQLTAENIVTDNDAVRNAIDRIKEFPVTLYQLGQFGVQAQQQPAGGGASTTTQRAVLDMISNMVNKLESDRS